MRILLLALSCRSGENRAVTSLHVFGHLLITRLKILRDLVFYLVRLLLTQGSTGYKTLLVEVANGFTAIDFLVNMGLSERGLVSLVVAMPAVAIHVDNDIPAKFLPILESKIGSPDEILRLFPIDMDHWCFNHLGNVRGVV